MILAGILYRRYGELPALRGVFAGLAAAAAGLLIATSRADGPRDASRIASRPAHIVAVVTFVAAGVLRVAVAAGSWRS